MTSQYQSYDQAVGAELDRRGRAQDEHFHHPVGSPMHAHAAVSVFRRTTKTALSERFISPQNNAAGAGQEVEWHIQSCGAYLLNCSFMAVAQPITSTAGPRFVDSLDPVDNVAYMDDFGFALIEWAEMELGCGGNQLEREYGRFWKALYDHHYNGDQRLNILVGDGTVDQRIGWSHLPHQLKVPLLWDVFRHYDKALRVSTYDETRITIRLRLRAMLDVVERLGTYRGAITANMPLALGGTGITAGAGAAQGANFADFTVGALTNLRIAAHYLHMSQADLNVLQRSGKRRHTFARTVQRVLNHRHLSTSTTEWIQTNFKNTLETFWIIPLIDAANLVGRGNRYFEFGGFSTVAPSGGTAEIREAPFAGVEFETDAGVRFSYSYHELTDWISANRHPRNPTDPSEKVAKWSASLFPSSSHPDSGVQLSMHQDKRIRVSWTHNGVSVPNVDMNLDVYGQTWTILEEDHNSAIWLL